MTRMMCLRWSASEMDMRCPFGEGILAAPHHLVAPPRTTDRPSHPTSSRSFH